MYGIVDRPLRKPKALRSPIPTYDVKIIAGRRVVIFHDNKSQVASATESYNNQNTNTPRYTYQIYFASRNTYIPKQYIYQGGYLIQKYML